jgi:hypothetical protein
VDYGRKEEAETPELVKVRLNGNNEASAQMKDCAKGETYKGKRPGKANNTNTFIDQHVEKEVAIDKVDWKPQVDPREDGGGIL